MQNMQGQSHNIWLFLYILVLLPLVVKYWMPLWRDLRAVYRDSSQFRRAAFEKADILSCILSFLLWLLPLHTEYFFLISENRVKRSTGMMPNSIILWQMARRTTAPDFRGIQRGRQSFLCTKWHSMLNICWKQRKQHKCSRPRK